MSPEMATLDATTAAPTPTRPSSSYRHPYPRLAILGGGIAGLTLSIALRTRSIPHVLFEATPAFGTVGAGIALGPNSTRAMSLISPELRAMYESMASGNTSPEKQHVFADFLLSEPGLGQIRGFYGAEVGGGSFVKSSAYRKDLIDGLESMLDKDCINLGMRATAVTRNGDQVKVVFQDGSEHVFDAVIGCDGAKGVSRAAVVPPQFVDAKYSGRYVYRALLPPGKAQEILGDVIKDGKIFIGQGVYFGLYLLSRGRYNFLCGTQKNMDWPDKQWTKEVTREEMLADFAGCDERLLTFLQYVEPVRWALFHHFDTPTYASSRVALVGDVAHASTPHQGSGAGQCFEDVAVLSHLLTLVTDKTDLDIAFDTYDSICRPRGQGIVHTSDEAGRIFTFTQPELGDDIAAITQNLQNRFTWIWEHDLQSDIRRAEETFTQRKTKLKNGGR